MKKIKPTAFLVAMTLLGGCGTSSSSSAPRADANPASADDVETAADEAGLDRVSTESAASKPSVQYSDDAFRMAAYEGNIDIVRRAVETGTEIDATDPDRDYTALLMAAYNGHDHIVRYLLEKGAKVDARDSEGKTPLMHAASGDFPDAVTSLLDAGADINATESTEGFTALMTAAAMGEANVVKLLLDRGADPAIQDEDDDTAKDHARNAGKNNVVDLLP